MIDPVNPPHYRGDRVMRIIEQYGLGFCLGNVVKYVLRHEAKAGIEDLRKARWYLDRAIQHGIPRDPDPRSVHPDREDDVAAIVAEFGLGSSLGSAVSGILRRGEGTSTDDLRAALRFLDRKILVVSAMLGIDLAVHVAAPPPLPVAPQADPVTADDVGLRWTVVHQDEDEDEVVVEPLGNLICEAPEMILGDPMVRRYPVPGGWLYQVSGRTRNPDGRKITVPDWYAPVFVPYVGPRTRA